MGFYHISYLGLYLIFHPNILILVSYKAVLLGHLAMRLYLNSGEKE